MQLPNVVPKLHSVGTCLVEQQQQGHSGKLSLLGSHWQHLVPLSSGTREQQRPLHTVYMHCMTWTLLLLGPVAQPYMLCV